jgi:hypothetical protein
MTSLKRSAEADPFASNISSKVFVRSTRKGKVQKIVREVYLRQDIPCSSNICKRCLQIAPKDAAGNGMHNPVPVSFRALPVWYKCVRWTACLTDDLTWLSAALRLVGEAGRNQGVP